MSHLTPVPNDPQQLLRWLAEQAGPDPFAPFRNRAIDLPKPPRAVRELTVKVSLRGAKPPIWRRLVLPGDLKLGALHQVLQVAMGWTDSHLHRFYAGPSDRGPYFLSDWDVDEGEDGTPESAVRVDQVLREPGDRLTYEYDFGDGWSHDVRLESVADPAGDALPRCTAGRRACPPEDVGGLWGYGELVDWHRAGRTTEALPGNFEDIEHALSWLPLDWDPDRFDVDEVNEQLTLAAGAARVIEDVHPRVAKVLGKLDALGAGLCRHLLAGADRRPLSADELVLATRHWQVLLDAVGDDVRLTAAGYLPPAKTQAVFNGLGIGDRWMGKGNREDLTPPVADLREAAELVGILRKAKGRLAPTAKVRGAAPDVLFRVVASRLPCGRIEAERDAGLFALVVLASGRTGDAVYDDVAFLMRSRGWGVDGGPIDRHHAIGLTRPTRAALAGHTGRGFPDWTPRAAAAALFTG